MFTKRKGIVIGETYLFDVLNETNMANSTSLVTVVKKEKADTYVVVSVNCGDVFRTKAKYLTPYVDPKTASVVRCQYGTTEFNDADIKFFDIVEGTIDMLTDCFKELNIEEDIIEQASSLKIINKKMKKKIQKYVDISNYKDNINVMLKSKGKFMLEQKNANNRTSETGIKKGLETNSCPNNRKNSTRQKTLEIFVSKIYKEITNVVNLSVFKQIEYLRKIS